MKKITFASIYLAAMIILTACGSVSENSESEMAISENTIESIENIESAESLESAENVESTESLESAGNIESTESLEATDSKDTIQETKTTENETLENSEQEFTSIEIELTAGTLKILSGDEFSLIYDGGKTADYSITDDTLNIPIQNSGDMTLTLPDDYIYDTVTISVSKGNLYAEQSFSARELNLDLTEGEVKLEELSASESCVVNIKQGSAFLYGTISGIMEAQCNEGHIQIHPSGRQSDFNYNLGLSDSSIQIEEENYHGTLQKEIDNSADNTMNLSCTKGDISVEFE